MGEPCEEVRLSANRRSDGTCKVIKVQWLCDIVDRPDSQRLPGHRDVFVSGHHNDGECWVDSTDQLEGPHAVHVGHADIEQHEIRARRNDAAEPLAPVRRAVDRMASFLKELAQEFHDLEIVVDD